MATVKKIILFLFGIVLIVFGNKVAIDTLFKGDDGLKEADLSEKETDIKNPVTTEEVETQQASVDETNIVPVSKASDEVYESKSVATATAKSRDKAVKEHDTKSTDKIEDEKVKDGAKTEIEPVKEESAAASE